jgi:hypothetical protein
MFADQSVFAALRHTLLAVEDGVIQASRLGSVIINIDNAAT